MKDITIAIDGYSSTGKSTLAKALARELEMVYVDTGAMYRAVTLFAMQSGFIDDSGLNKHLLIDALNGLEVTLVYNRELNTAEAYLNGKSVDKDIRNMAVSNHVSLVAALPEVRRKLVEQQKAMGANGAVVMDGRDIGTVVFPDAEVKFFMTASAEVRAQRRFKELQERGDAISYQEVYDNLISRDELDSSRKDSPLIKAEDALEIDNSDMSIQEQLSMMLEMIKRRTGRC